MLLPGKEGTNIELQAIALHFSRTIHLFDGDSKGKIEEPSKIFNPDEEDKRPVIRLI